MMRSIVLGALCVCSVREDEVAGLGGGQRGRDRLEVAHLAEEDHVGVLAQRAAERVGEARRVLADLALVDDAALVMVQELDRVLDRDDVIGAASRLISSMIEASVVDLPEPVGPVTRTRPRGLHGELVEARRAGRAPRASWIIGRDRAEGGGEALALVVGVDAEAGERRGTP